MLIAMRSGIPGIRFASRLRIWQKNS